MAIAPIPGASAVGIDCPPILRNLTDYVAFNPQRDSSQMALLGYNGFFKSPFQNGVRPLASDVAPTADGKLYTVTLTWLKRAIDSDLTDCATVDVCTPGTNDDYTSVPVAFSPICTSFKVTLDQQEYIKSCKDPQGAKMESIYTKLDRAARAHETKLMTEIISNYGASALDDAAGAVAVGTNYVMGTTITNADGTINPLALHELNEFAEENDVFDATPVILMGNQHPFGNYVDTVRRIGCCNDKGVDMMEAADAFGMARFRSRWVANAINAATIDTVAGDAKKWFAMVHPGSVHHIEFFNYDGPNAWEHGQSYGTTFINPFDGEKWDVHQHFDDCNKPTWTLVFNKQSMVFGMPTTLYKTGDRLEGVNGVWGLSLA